MNFKFDHTGSVLSNFLIALFADSNERLFLISNGEKYQALIPSLMKVLCVRFKSIGSLIRYGSDLGLGDYPFYKVEVEGWWGGM